MATDPTTDLQSDQDSSAAATAGGSATRSPAPDPHDDQGHHGEADDVGWRTVATPTLEATTEAPLPLRRVLAQLALGVAVVLVVVTVGGTYAARRLAEREAVTDAANIADVFADAVVQPALSDRLVTGEPEALADFDTLVDEQVLGATVVHVKLWTPDGRVVYADQDELIGQTFELDEDQRAALEDPRTKAEISNLDRDENTLERTGSDKLVEVYRPVWTPSGEQMLFEIYAPYDKVSERSGQLWRGFAGVTLSSLLLFLILLAPLFWHLLSRVRRSQRQRELLLQRSVDASSSERRLIAASLHDGPVQDLAATSFVVAGATARAKAAGQHWLVDELANVAGSVRTSIRALRSLLVEIYPATLAQAGLGAALDDLVQSLRAPGLEVRLHHDDPEELGLTRERERLVYRIAQETLRNVAKHAAPCTASVTLYRVGDEVVLDVLDDGNGFDVDARLSDPEPGHFGLQLLADLAATGGGLLQVASVVHRGTHWRLRLPTGAPLDLEEEGPHD